MAHPADGLKPIERISVGDRVWAFDHPNLRWVERPVAEIFRNQNEGPMATIRVAGETVRATGGHPFWVVDGVDLAERRPPERIPAVEPGGLQPGRWVLAMDLRAGDVVLRRDGEFSRLDSVEVDETEETVYNFRVRELENYAVGACGVLVHNTNEGVTGGGNAAPGAEAATQGQKVYTTIDRPLDLNRPGTGATNKMSGTLTAEGRGDTFVTTTDLSNPTNLQKHIMDNVPKLYPEMKYVYEIEVPTGGLKTDLTELPPRPINGNINPNTPGVKVTRVWEFKWTYDPARGFDVPTLVEVPVPGK